MSIKKAANTRVYPSLLSVEGTLAILHHNLGVGAKAIQQGLDLHHPFLEDAMSGNLPVVSCACLGEKPRKYHRNVARVQD